MRKMNCFVVFVCLFGGLFACISFVLVWVFLLS